MYLLGKDYSILDGGSESDRRQGVGGRGGRGRVRWGLGALAISPVLAVLAVILHGQDVPQLGIHSIQVFIRRVVL